MRAKSILLVEDNPDDEALLIRALGSCNFCNPYVVVSDGKEALDYLFCKGEFSKRNFRDFPAVIFLDLSLPILSGLEVLKKIRQDEVMKVIPVVILTSSGTKKDIISSYMLGANSFIRKPVKFHDYVNTVKEVAGYWLRLNELPTD